MHINHVVSASGVLKRVLLSRPDYLELTPIDTISISWIEKGEKIDVEKARKEHDELIRIYEGNGVKVDICEPRKPFVNMVFARDFGFNLKEGFVLGHFREPVRQRESEIYAKEMEKLGIPMIAKCTKGVIEGGDFWQLDEKTLAIGILQRSNEEGVMNIRKQLEPYGYKIMTIASDPKYLHLDMIFNIVAEKVAVTYWDGLPKHFQEYLKKEQYDIIKINEEGVFKHFSNLQALGNRKVISLKENIEVNQQLRAHGLEVFELDATEILKTGGGPHCMTFPVCRS